MAARIKHVQKLLKRHNFITVSTRCYNYKWYDKKEGIPLDLQILFQQDYDFTLRGFKRKWKQTEMEYLKDSQKYIPERHQMLGPDLATSHFIVKRGGAVKFANRETWFKMDKNEKYFLPNRRVEGMHLEAVDASKTELVYTGFDNFVELEHLRYLSLSQCRHIDDWCMSRLHMFGDTLEFLDISGCPQITDDGLACVHHLEKLQGLKVGHLPKVKHLQLMTLLLEEALPKLKVFGVDFTQREQNENDSSVNSETNNATVSRKQDKT